MTLIASFFVLKYMWYDNQVHYVAYIFNTYMYYFFLRGSSYNDGNDSGIFSFRSDTGEYSSAYGFCTAYVNL
ncbi:MAG: hypothetical protein PHE54_00280 [Bacilli bacterium]|nr:hypothetical protein [Bacilli bacterium]